MPTVALEVNGKRRELEVSPDMPLLWVLRDMLGLTGTKYGCGAGLCGACTVLVGGEAVRSCSVAVGGITERSVLTIEGLASGDDHPLVAAWEAERVSQCGYCQPGQIMSAAALLAKTARPSDREIDRAMRGNLCRCGTYARIRRAIHRAADGV